MWAPGAVSPGWSEGWLRRLARSTLTAMALSIISRRKKLPGNMAHAAAIHGVGRHLVVSRSVNCLGPRLGQRISMPPPVRHALCCPAHLNGASHHQPTKQAATHRQSLLNVSRLPPMTPVPVAGRMLGFTSRSAAYRAAARRASHHPHAPCWHDGLGSCCWPPTHLQHQDRPTRRTETSKPG